MFEVNNKINKDVSFKVRMTTEEKEKLDFLSKVLNLSSSEVLRQGMIILYDLNKNVFKNDLNAKNET